MFGFYGISTIVGYLMPNPFLYILKFVTLVEGHLKAPFSIATTLRYRGGATPFPGLLHFTLDPHLIVLHQVPFF